MTELEASGREATGMAALVAAHDWAATPLEAKEGWPQPRYELGAEVAVEFRPQGLRFALEMPLGQDVLAEPAQA